jgi:hexosaminidase
MGNDVEVVLTSMLVEVTGTVAVPGCPRYMFMGFENCGLFGFLNVKILARAAMKKSPLFKSLQSHGLRTARCRLALMGLFLLAMISFAVGQTLFSDNFDSYASPVAVTNVGTTNGYNIKFSASSGPVDFKAVFGFDYSTLTYPTNVGVAPHSSGTSKGLFLTVNKDSIGAVASVNLYPTNRSFSGNYMVQFDAWLSYQGASTTEHFLYGINHSGQFTNESAFEGSDGLMFAMCIDGSDSATSTTLRDYSVLQGGGLPLAPALLITNNTTFGPAPLLGNRFDSSDPGFVALFPAKPVTGFSSTAGAAAFRWVTVQVLQKDGLITWMFNSNIVAQYTNTTAYTNGDIMLGFNDTFASIGTSNDFAIIDNVIVSALPSSIVSQPASQTVAVGDNVIFSVTATSNAALSYQWLFNGTNLVNNGHVSGAQSGSLSISSAAAGDAGPYQVIVSNAAGAVTSSVATLTVVSQITEAVSWATPAGITYGTPLSSSQLNASANVPGTFAYNFPLGTVLGAGTRNLSVLFTPTDQVRYTNTTVNVSLVVAPAPLSVTAANATRPYGLPNPAFAGSVAGLQNGDGVEASYSCSATTSSPAGTYQIVPALVDPNNLQTNYTVSLFNGTLSVTPGLSLVTAASTSIVPLPVAVTNRPGIFVLCPSQPAAPVPGHALTEILVDASSLQTGQYLAAALYKSTGYQFRIATNSATNAVRGAILITTSNAIPTLGTEGYELTVAPDSVVVRAPAQGGTFYGVQSFLQLLPPQIYSQRVVPGIAWSAPCVYVQDQPAFSWRGVMLDPARHFISKQETKQVIDALAVQKINTLHWHLVDDQSWCLEITNFPNLTAIGAFHRGIDYGLPPRSTSATNAAGQYGGFYSQSDAREIVAYALERHITVVPEIEMPCHSTPGLVAYPQFGCGNNVASYNQDYPFINYPIDLYSLGTPGTIPFLQEVLTEVMQIFPSKYIHTGGDEVVASGDTQWNSYNADVTNMLALGITPNGTTSIVAYQHWFSTNMAAFVQSQGRVMMGWTEFENGGIVTNAALMDWQTGSSSRAVAAATNGQPVVMSPNATCYINYVQGTNVSIEPLFIVGGVPQFCSVSNVYSFNPIPAGLPAAFKTNILGGQCNLWAEYIPSFRNVMYKLFPRACALAEVTWTPQASQNYQNFTNRLAIHEQRLDQMGVNYNRETIPQIGAWGPSVSASPSTITLDITPYVTAAGEIDVNFVRTAGNNGLQITSVALLQNGAQVDIDAHVGIAAKSASAYTVYILNLPETKPGATYTLQAVVSGYNGTATSGTIYLPNWN